MRSALLALLLAVVPVLAQNCAQPGSVEERLFIPPAGQKQCRADGVCIVAGVSQPVYQLKVQVERSRADGSSFFAYAIVTVDRSTWERVAEQDTYLVPGDGPCLAPGDHPSDAVPEATPEAEPDSAPDYPD